MKATMKMTTLAALAAALLSTSANAESRVWTDAKGKTIEAEMVRVLNSQVVLRLANGREIKVSLDTLSATDRDFAMLSQPPTLELNVSAKTDRTNESLFQIGRGSRIQVEKESTVVTVDVVKQSSAAYEVPLKAVLYVMGERDGENAAVLDKVTETFVYVDGEKEFEFVSGEYNSERLEGELHGEAYKGWLVAVLDINGGVVAMKSSTGEYEQHADVLLAAEKGAVLSAEYETLTSESKPMLAINHRF